MTLEEARAMIREKCPDISKGDNLKLARLLLKVDDTAWHEGFDSGYSAGYEQGERIPGM